MLLDREGITYTAIEIDQVQDGMMIQREVMRITGQRTVPAIWIDGEFIGGSSDLVELHEAGGLKA